jgi:GntR family transcriptional regulator
MVDPIYLEIADDLRHKIEEGELEPGQQLPTEAELRGVYGASRNTIRGAIQELSVRGLVTSQPGRGTFVKPSRVKLNVNLSSRSGSGSGGGEGANFVREALVQNHQATSSPPRVEVQQATAELAKELMIDLKDQVVSRHELRFVDGEPWSLQTSFYPMSFVTEGATDLLLAVNIPDGVVNYLETKLGHRQVGYQDKLSVRSPDQNETAFFRLPSRGGGPPVIVTRRTGFDTEGKPMRYTVTVYPSDRNLLYFNVGEVPEPKQIIENPPAAGSIDQ